MAMSERSNDYDDLLDDTEHGWRNRLIGLAVLMVLVAAGVYALWATLLRRASPPDDRQGQGIP